MIHGVTPVLGVSDSRAAEEFYCGKLGFELQFAYRPFRDHDDPCHMGVKRDDAVMRVSSFSGDGVPRTSVIIWTDNVDVLHEEFVSKGVCRSTWVRPTKCGAFARYTSAMPTRTSWSSRRF